MRKDNSFLLNHQTFICVFQDQYSRFVGIRGVAGTVPLSANYAIEAFLALV